MIRLAIKYNREKLGEGIHYNTIINTVLKTNSIVVNFVTGLSEETAPLNAAVSYILAGSSKEYPTYTELYKKQWEMYSGFIRGSVSKIGDSQDIIMEAGCINDRFALHGEHITEEITRILAGCITEPHIENGVFCEKDFALKKRDLITDIQAEINEKRSFAFKRANLNTYRGEPAALSVYGEEARAEKMTSAEVFEQYKKVLKTSRIEIFFVGAEEVPACKKILKDAFDSVGREYKESKLFEKSSVKEEICRVTEKYDVAQSKMVMAFKTDCSDRFSMTLMNSIFGGSPTSKLFMNVREKLSLCYYCSSGYNVYKGSLTVDSGVENQNIAKAEEEILNQLEAMRRGDFTDEEFDNAVKGIVNSWKSTKDGGLNLAAWYLVRMCLGDILSPDEEIDRLMKVTRENVIKAAKSLKLDTVYVLTGKENNE